MLRGASPKRKPWDNGTWSLSSSSVEEVVIWYPRWLLIGKFPGQELAVRKPQEAYICELFVNALTFTLLEAVID